MLNTLITPPSDRRGTFARSGIAWETVMNELAMLAESGDLHALMLEVNRRWAERYHPDSSFVTLMVDKGRGMPMVTEVIPLEADDLSEPRRPRFASQDR